MFYHSAFKTESFLRPITSRVNGFCFFVRTSNDCSDGEPESSDETNNFPFKSAQVINSRRIGSAIDFSYLSKCQESTNRFGKCICVSAVDWFGSLTKK